MEVPALKCYDCSGIFTKGTILRKSELQPNDILIDIKYAGICHSDLHQGRAEWPIDCYYPMSPGHEIAGLVEAVGSGVTKFAVGQRVGVGCFVDSCRNCDSCSAGFEQYCNGEVPSPSEQFNLPDKKVNSYSTYNACIGDTLAAEKGYPDSILYGGYSKKIVVHEEYTCPIPDNLDFAKAAPLLCAGITLYSPLKFYGAADGGLKVMIVGLGGLGSMGAKISKAMGNQVWVASTSTNKQSYVEDTLGCKFIYTGRTVEEKKNAFNQFQKHFDLVISTVSADMDLHPYIATVKSQCTFCMVGLPPSPLEIQPFSIIARRIKIGGSLIGGIAETIEMLNFCSDNDIACDIKLIPAKDVNIAWQEITKNTIGAARFVMDIGNTLDVEGEWECELPVDPVDHVVHKDATIHGAEDQTGKRYNHATSSFVDP